MDHMRVAIGLIAAGFTCVSCVAYIRAIASGASSTRWSSWLIWTVSSAAGFATYYGSGARESVWVPLAYVVVCAAICAVALWRRSEGGLSRVEVLCLVGAALSLGVWWVSGSAVSGQVACVVVEVIAYIPIWLTARNENKPAWLLETAGSALNMLAISPLSFALLLYPSAVLACNVLVVALLPWTSRSRQQQPEAEVVLA